MVYNGCSLSPVATTWAATYCMHLWSKITHVGLKSITLKYDIPYSTLLLAFRPQIVLLILKKPNSDSSWFSSKAFENCGLWTILTNFILVLESPEHLKCLLSPLMIYSWESFLTLVHFTWSPLKQPCSHSFQSLLHSYVMYMCIYSTYCMSSLQFTSFTDICTHKIHQVLP